MSECLIEASIQFHVPTALPLSAEPHNTCWIQGSLGFRPDIFGKRTIICYPAWNVILSDPFGSLLVPDDISKYVTDREYVHVSNTVFFGGFCCSSLNWYLHICCLVSVAVWAVTLLLSIRNVRMMRKLLWRCRQLKLLTVTKPVQSSGVCVLLCVCVTLDSPAENEDFSNCPCRENVLWDLRFAQQCSWGFRSSEKWCLVGWVVRFVMFRRNWCLLHGSRSARWTTSHRRHGSNLIQLLFRAHVGWDTSVGIATRYGLDILWIKSQWGEIFCTCPAQPWGTPSLLYNGYQVFPGGKAAGARRWPPTPI